MDEVLKFVTLDGVSEKKRKNSFVFFLQNFYDKMTHFYDLFFYLSFGLKDLFWAAQNVHKINIKITGRHKLNY